MRQPDCGPEALRLIGYSQQTIFSSEITLNVADACSSSLSRRERHATRADQATISWAELGSGYHCGIDPFFSSVGQLKITISGCEARSKRVRKRWPSAVTS